MLRSVVITGLVLLSPGLWGRAENLSREVPPWYAESMEPLLTPLEPPVLSVVAPGDPLPPGWSAVKLDPRTTGNGGTNPPGTIIRYTLDGPEAFDGGDPSTVEFPLYSQGQVNISGVYLGGANDWINVPNGTVIRARTAIVDFRTTSPPQDSDSIVERVVSESRTFTTFTP